MKSTPKEALTMYLRSRENEVADATLRSTEYRLNHFVRWCDENGIETIDQLEKEDFHHYRVWRREDGDLARASEKTQMDSLRVFVRWCCSMGMLPNGMDEAVISPTLRPADNQSGDIVESEEVEEILAHLRRFRFASRDHVVFHLLWRTGLRTGGLRSLDVSDFHSDERYLDLEHEPETDTPLKNNIHSERLVSITTESCELLETYLQQNHTGVTDDHGRSPLIATKQGRAARTTIRRTIYRFTRPCLHSKCPHGRNPDDCKAAKTSDHAYECPSSTAPHSVRRGAITHLLRNDVPDKTVSDRCNVSDEVMDQHYDERNKRERMEQRRDFLDNI